MKLPHEFKTCNGLVTIELDGIVVQYIQKCPPDDVVKQETTSIKTSAWSGRLSEDYYSVKKVLLECESKSDAPERPAVLGEDTP